MVERAGPLTPALTDDDAGSESTLRPRRLEQYFGQERIKESLRIAIEAARGREEPLDHLLFHGPPGLGKTTLAMIMAAEMGVSIRITSGPAIERAGELASLLTSLQPGDILFIDEIHRLSLAVEEVLYPAMEDFSVDIILGKGPKARDVRLKLHRFTLIGATTRVRARLAAAARSLRRGLPARVLRRGGAVAHRAAQRRRARRAASTRAA